MKLLIYLALVGVIVSEVCHAQTTCTDDELITYTQQFATSCARDCPINFCDCCTDASSAGNAEECCSAYAKLLNCGYTDASVSACSSLPGVNGGSVSDGAVTIAISFVVNGVLVFVSAAVTQLFL